MQECLLCDCLYVFLCLHACICVYSTEKKEKINTDVQARMTVPGALRAPLGQHSYF